MKYTAEITNKDISDGLLTVQVRFTSEDRKVIVQDAFSTRSAQEENWLTNMVIRKARELEELDALLESIETGDVPIPHTAASTTAKPSANTAKDAYKADLETLNAYANAMRKGATDEKNVDFVALQKRLAKNFKKEYLDLFR